MTSPALIIASGAALTSGRRSARCGPENVPNNYEILAFNEARARNSSRKAMIVGASCVAINAPCQGTITQVGSA
jgi:hypothetical protein